MSEYSEEEISKLKAVNDALKNLEGVPIPFNIIKANIIPLSDWLKEILGEIR